MLCTFTKKTKKKKKNQIDGTTNFWIILMVIANSKY